jgi:tRNA (cytidine/uridine-2'-O-)-methyltransferase
MLHIALWEPEIPPNTGNIARLCAATGTRLHLIGKLGYDLSDKQLKRAGLDYWPLVDIQIHATWDDFVVAIGTARLWLIENPAPASIYTTSFADGDVLLFGKESTGLPDWLKEQHVARMIDVPIRPNTVRSLNLSTTAGIVLYEALRQTGWTNSLAPANAHRV